MWASKGGVVDGFEGFGGGGGEGGAFGVVGDLHEAAGGDGVADGGDGAEDFVALAGLDGGLPVEGGEVFDGFGLGEAGDGVADFIEDGVAAAVVVEEGGEEDLEGFGVGDGAEVFGEGGSGGPILDLVDAGEEGLDGFGGVLFGEGLGDGVEFLEGGGLVPDGGDLGRWRRGGEWGADGWCLGLVGGWGCDGLG